MRTMTLPLPDFKSEYESADLFFFHQGIRLELSYKIFDTHFTYIPVDDQSFYKVEHPKPLFSRFFVFIDGEAELISPKAKILKDGIYHLPPAWPFTINYHQKCKFVSIHIDFRNSCGRSPFETNPELQSIQDKTLSKLFIDAYNAENKLRMMAATLEATARFLEPYGEEMIGDALKAQYFGKLFEYVRKTPKARLSVTELAELYEITPNALSRRFSRKMGKSLKEFLTEAHVKEAQHLLLTTDMSISDLANRLGHSSSHYFHRFFMKHCNCTPREYRLKHQTAEDIILQ